MVSLHLPWLTSSKVLVFGPLLLTLVFILACGASATSTPPPTNTPLPTNTSAPTSQVNPTGAPSDGELGTPQVAPAFNDYWKIPEIYGRPVNGGHLRITYEDPLDHANPWGAWTGAAVRLRAPTMNKLLDTNPYDSDQIIPDLAWGWTVHDDLMGITFYLHDDVQWHNGDAFTCEDARFFLETVVTGEGLTTSELKGSMSFIDVTETRCLDDLTLEVHFNQANTTALLVFYHRTANIFSKEWFQEGGERAATTDLSVGTGPFVWASGQRLGVDEQYFEKNPNYFKEGLPYLDEVSIHGIVDESAQQAAMLSHQTDWHWVRNWGQYDAYVDHEQIITVIRPIAGALTIWLNKHKPPLDNLRVRQAIFMGIDRNAAIEVLQDGHGSLGFQVPPGAPWDLDPAKGCEIPAWCPPEDGDMERQRAEARAILEEEGFPFDKTFVMTVETDNQQQTRATFIQEQLRLLGINVDFDLVETVAWRKQAAEGTWGDILPQSAHWTANDPSLGLSFLFRCNSSFNHWGPNKPCDEKAETLLDQLAAAVDPEERNRLSDEMQLHTMREYWRFVVYWEQEAVAFWPEVRGYVHMPNPLLSHIRWEHMWIDPAHKDDRDFSGQTTGFPGGI